MFISSRQAQAPPNINPVDINHVETNPVVVPPELDYFKPIFPVSQKTKEFLIELEKEFKAFGGNIASFEPSESLQRNYQIIDTQRRGQGWIVKAMAKTKDRAQSPVQLPLSELSTFLKNANNEIFEVALKSETLPDPADDTIVPSDEYLDKRPGTEKKSNRNRNLIITAAAILLTAIIIYLIVK